MRRAVDVVVAAVALAALWPLFALLALLVFLDSGRPIFYRGVRVGRNAQEFRMWKFRSMIVGADRFGSVSGPNDSRTTRIGALMRATKLDELPQFVNLLRGHLTLVGPRPEVPSMVARYDARQKSILQYTPGITSPGEIYFTEVQEPTIPGDADPEQYFYDSLLDQKLDIDFAYFSTRTMLTDIDVVGATVKLILSALLRHLRLSF